MLRIGNDLSNAGFTRQTSTSRDYGGALGWLLGQLDTNDDGKYDPRRGGDLKREVRIFGHSWGGTSAILLSRDIDGDRRFADDKVDVLATIDPVYNYYTGATYRGGAKSNVKTFWNRYETGNTDIPVEMETPIGPIVFLRPHGNAVPSAARNGGDQVDVNSAPRQVNGSNPHDHFSIITHVEAPLQALLTR